MSFNQSYYFSELPTKDARLEALGYLVSLLPVSNRDTLWALLNFLSTVDQHSTDKVGEDGQTVSFIIFTIIRKHTRFNSNLTINTSI